MSYTHPEVLVSTDWVQEHLNDPKVRIVEVDYDPIANYQLGHIPGAVLFDWRKDLNHPLQRDILSKEQLEQLFRKSGIGNDTKIALYGKFKPYEDIKKLYEAQGVTGDKDIVAYCRIGERSSFSWFVLKYLLGYPKVRNYDGSWTEWGNLVRNPIEKPATAIAQTVSA